MTSDQGIDGFALSQPVKLLCMIRLYPLVFGENI